MTLCHTWSTCHPHCQTHVLADSSKIFLCMFHWYPRSSLWEASMHECVLTTSTNHLERHKNTSWYRAGRQAGIVGFITLRSKVCHIPHDIMPDSLWWFYLCHRQMVRYHCTRRYWTLDCSIPAVFHNDSIQGHFEQYKNKSNLHYCRQCLPHRLLHFCNHKYPCQWKALCTFRFMCAPWCESWKVSKTWMHHLSRPVFIAFLSGSTLALVGSPLTKSCMLALSIKTNVDCTRDCAHIQHTGKI